MTNTRKVVPEESISEVAAFVESKNRIERLKEAYPEVFEQFDMLKEDYNAKLQAAEKAVRARGVSCGPFTILSTSTTYDAGKLFEHLGRKEFLANGGTEKTVTKYEIDKARLEASIAQGKIKKEVVDEVKSVTHRYRKPGEIDI